jgi:hypothetical protein
LKGLICLAFATQSMAQLKTPPMLKPRIDIDYLKAGHLGFYVGTVLPVANFASTDYFNEKSGYANLGMLYQVEAGYEIFPWLGAKITYSNYQNPLNKNAIVANLNEFRFFDRIPIIGGSSRVEAMRAGNYSMRGVLAGAYYPFHSSTTTIEVYAQAGLMNTIDPELRFAVVNTSNNQVFDVLMPEKRATDAAYVAGFNLRTRLYKSVQFTAGGHYLYAEQRMSDNRIFIRGNNMAAGYLLSTYTLYVQTVNLHIGIAFEFE